MGGDFRCACLTRPPTIAHLVPSSRHGKSKSGKRKGNELMKLGTYVFDIENIRVFSKKLISHALCFSRWAMSASQNACGAGD